MSETQLRAVRTYLQALLRSHLGNLAVHVSEKSYDKAHTAQTKIEMLRELDGWIKLEFRMLDKGEVR